MLVRLLVLFIYTATYDTLKIERKILSGDVIKNLTSEEAVKFCGDETKSSCSCSNGQTFFSKFPNNCNKSVSDCVLKTIVGDTLSDIHAAAKNDQSDSLYSVNVTTHNRDAVCLSELTPGFVMDYNNGPDIIWNAKWASMIMQRMKTEIVENKIRVTFSRFWTGLLLRVFVGCNDKCFAIKFQGDIEYPLKDEYIKEVLGPVFPSLSTSSRRVITPSTSTVVVTSLTSKFIKNNQPSTSTILELKITSSMRNLVMPTSRQPLQPKTSSIKENSISATVHSKLGTTLPSNTVSATSSAQTTTTTTITTTATTPITTTVATAATTTTTTTNLDTTVQPAVKAAQNAASNNTTYIIVAVVLLLVLIAVLLLCIWCYYRKKRKNINLDKRKEEIAKEAQTHQNIRHMNSQTQGMASSPSVLNAHTDKSFYDDINTSSSPVILRTKLNEQHLRKDEHETGYRNEGYGDSQDKRMSTYDVPAKRKSNPLYEQPKEFHFTPFFKSDNSDQVTTPEYAVIKKVSNASDDERVDNV